MVSLHWKEQTMNPLDERQIGQHVMILGWLHIAGSVIFLAIAAFLFILLTGIGVATRDTEAVAVLGVVATAVSALLTLLALPGLLAGIGLLMRKNWARVLAIVVGILNLVNIPIGTVIGVYTLWVLLQNSATPYFQEKSQEEALPLRPHEGHPI
jgi:hypothetical protein